MLQKDMTYQREFELLFHELDDISSGDMGEYLNFLVQRRYLIQMVLNEGGTLNN